MIRCRRMKLKVRKGTSNRYRMRNMRFQTLRITMYY